MFSMSILNNFNLNFNIFQFLLGFYMTWLWLFKLNRHRSQIGRYNYLNCSMKVVYYIFTSTPGVVRTHFRTNPRIQVFWENQFFSFCGAPKNFFWPQTPYLALETLYFGGVILLKLFIPSCGFRDIQDWFCPKMAVLVISNS